MTIDIDNYNSLAWWVTADILNRLDEDIRALAIAKALLNAYKKGQADGYIQEQKHED